MAIVTLRALREAVGAALRDAMNSDEVEDFCTSIGLDPPEGAGDAYSSKRAYVVRRLAGKTESEVLEIGRRALDECHAESESAIALAAALAGIGPVGVLGDMKNLIFAADGPKPQVVLSDALNNDLVVVRNEQYCLVYDRPLGPDGLTWRQLCDWWSARQQLSRLSEREVWVDLYQRLNRSLDNDAERRILTTYIQRYIQHGPDVPALIPQVYLHYDPFDRRHYLPGVGPLVRQRMDFLLLLPSRVRVVIECDGVQHYADPASGLAEPRRYAEMVSEDRALRLRGYEVYRFGGHELQDGPDTTARLTAFFDALAARHESASVKR